MSRSSDTITKVGYLGPKDRPGKTYTHSAALQYFEGWGDVEYVPGDSDEICEGILDGELDYGVLPAENNTGGFVADTLYALYSHDGIQILDEEYIPIHHQLMVNPRSGTDLTNIRAVYSHVQVFAQCRASLQKLEAEIGVKIEKNIMETTGHAVNALELNSQSEAVKGLAAIGSKGLSDDHDFSILLPNFEDREDNMTRFWIIWKRGRFNLANADQSADAEHLDDIPVRAEKNRTTFIIHLKHESGTVEKLLSLFALREINMLWIQPHPFKAGVSGRFWQYAFIIEFEGHITDIAMMAAVNDLRLGLPQILYDGVDNDIRIPARFLGSYPDHNPDTEN